MRNWRIVKIATTKAQRKLFFNLRSLKQGLEPLRLEQTRDLAERLSVKSSEVSEMETRLSGHDMALEPAGEDEEAYSPIAYLSDPESEPTHILERQQTERLQSTGIKHALESLDPRSCRIIEERWLREKDSATLHELAAEFKVSAERIRQLEQKALTKMKAVMGAG